MGIPISQNALLLVSQLAGIVLLVSIVWLLYKRRIYLDSVTKEPIAFELPLFGKLKSQSPVIILVLVAAVLILYPLQSSRADQATIEGYVETNGKPVTVTIVPVPRFQETVQSSGPFKIQVPIIPEVNYRAWFSVERHIATDQGFDVVGGEAKLVKFTYTDEITTPALVPLKEVSDDELKRLGIVR